MAIDRAKTLERAERLVSQGKIPAAIAEYRLLLQGQPDDLNLVNRLGDLLVRASKTAEAIELFGRAAHLYAQGGFFLKAIAIYRKILKLDPAVIEPRLCLADLYAHRDLVTDARAEYLAVVERLVKDGHKEKAKDVYQRIIRIDPGNVEARIALADLHVAGGSTVEAVKEMITASQDLERLGLREQAVLVQRRVLKLGDAGVEVHADAVRALSRLGCSEEAIAAARALRGAFPDERAPLEAMVEALELGGRPEQAEALVDSSLGGVASNPVPRIVLGRLHARAGQSEAAARELLRAARDLSQLGRSLDAARALDTLLTFAPSHREALEQRLDIARATGDTETSTQLSQRLITEFGGLHHASDPAEVGPEDARQQAEPRALPQERPLTREERDFLSEHLTEAEVFVKYGLFEKAIEPLNQVLARFPDHLEAHQRLRAIFTEQGNRIRVVEQSMFIAEIQERFGQRAEALKVLVEAKNLDPDNTVVLAWIDRLMTAPKAVGAAHSTDSGRRAGRQIPHPGEQAEEAGPRLDLAGEFGASLAAALEDDSQPEPEPDEEQGVAAAVKAFREKIGQVVSNDDFTTHYDLAIAYKEMGLTDEAISQLEYVSQDVSRFVECCAMLGLCYREKAMPSEAVKWYLEAIRSQRAGPEWELGLRFDLAEAYLEMGDVSNAREWFRQVAGIDRTYRDVAARLQEVERLA